MKVNMPEIDLGKYYLRDVCEADYLDLFEVLRHDEVTKYLTYNSLKKPNEALYMIREFLLKKTNNGHANRLCYCFKKTEELIGTIEFHTYLSGINACEIGFLLHPNYWHKGIMHKALGEMINLGFNYLDLDKNHCWLC
ncbi:MAG: GNAT family N-acetyltransferase [Clostridium sp.]|nr:MAG: GNAT family N-acetyltransferase [Clostridium sp.]